MAKKAKISADKYFLCRVCAEDHTHQLNTWATMWLFILPSDCNEQAQSSIAPLLLKQEYVY